MDKALLDKPSILRNSFVDVVYLSNKTDIPPIVKKLFREKKLSYILISLENSYQLRSQTELVGTVIIDTQDEDISHDYKLGRLIKWLEMQNVSVIILNEPISKPVKSFTITSSSNSFVIPNSVKSFSVDDLWVRISMNLAYRKKSFGMTSKPAIPYKIKRKSINNSTLAEQLKVTETMIGSLTEQLRLAGLVQRDFLPSKLPNSEHIQWAATYLPAEWVSGDIYDIARIDEDHIGFYLADAVGHSMPAALLTIFVKQALIMRETVGNDYRIFSPADVMKNLNVRMSGQKLSGYQFATCCYCLLNTKNLQLTYARAGHPYPILIRAGEPMKQLEVRGALLGVFEDAEYLQRTIQLQCGDKIILYSDGVEPLIGYYDEFSVFKFDDEFRVISHMPIVDILDRLNHWATDREVADVEIDDITIVGMEIL